MATDQVSLFGLKAALVLTDERGEFEVKRPFIFGFAGVAGDARLGTARVLDAIDARRAEALDRRPRY